MEIVRDVVRGAVLSSDATEILADTSEGKNAEAAKIESGNLPPEIKANQLKLVNQLHETVAANYLSMADAYRDASILQLETETGITNSEFYRRLFLIRLNELATPISTNMADNEQLF